MTRIEPLSYNLLLALYLAWRVARKGKSQVVISNSALKKYFKKDNVHPRRMKNFANSLKPVFPHSFS